jgi:hypothetical protein
MNPFDFIKSINQHEYSIDQLTENEYNPFITNRNFSLFPDTILYANLMNLNSHIDKKMQYDYYYNSIQKKNRFKKWPKKKNVSSENIELIQEIYKYNVNKAKQVLSALTESQIEMIKEKQKKGGVK